MLLPLALSCSVCLRSSEENASDDVCRVRIINDLCCLPISLYIKQIVWKENTNRCNLHWQLMIFSLVLSYIIVLNILLWNSFFVENVASSMLLKESFMTCDFSRNISLIIPFLMMLWFLFDIISFCYIYISYFNSLTTLGAIIFRYLLHTGCLN